MDTEAAQDPNVKQAVPFFMVSDIEASLRFYVDGLGCTMTNRWEVEGKLRWCWLQCGGAALMLQELTGRARDVRETEKAGVGVSICFICSDALALYRAFTARGILTEEPFVGNGMWVVSLTDPDGYRIDFESLTDVPEETLLSQVGG